MILLWISVLVDTSEEMLMKKCCRSLVWKTEQDEQLFKFLSILHTALYTLYFIPDSSSAKPLLSSVTILEFSKK